MCGIAGLVSRTDAPPDREVLQAMTAAVAHRGPDGAGVFTDRRVGLGHRRLAIIDLSDEAAQPMRCPSSGRVIVYNGEIYNYQELRAELSDGYTFRTHSDTEVVLAAYDRWGAACLSRFNGMWAFAIHDPVAGRLFCARDRFGVKPFYYVDDPRYFAFGSEIRQLLPLLSSRLASRPVLLAYLGFGIDERGDETFFTGIRRLAPGHFLTFNISQGTWRAERYYRIPRRSADHGQTPDQSAEALRALLTDAVRLRLRSDVPVGTCLSGGLDSSSIAALAAQLSAGTGHQFAAITAASESALNDESAYAQQVVAQSRLTWYRIQPDYAAFNGAINEVVRAQEEPFSTPSVCLQFFVMQEARRRGIPVLLDGQGGDETLLGYERYSVPALREVHAGAGLFASVRAMRDLARNNAKLPLQRQVLMLGYFSSSAVRWRRLRRRLGSPTWFPSRAHFDRHFGTSAASVFECQRRELEEDTVPHLLRYEDKNSMWHAIETRLPFLDYRLVEFALNLPVTTKLAQGWTKWPLREAMRGRLPDEVIWRRSKQGFEAPDHVWLPRKKADMLAAVRSSILLREVCGADVGLAAASLPLLALWRMYIVALWELEFRVLGMASA